MSTHYNYKQPKPYTFLTFLWDAMWFILTGGLWIFYILIRYMRTGRRR